MGIGNLGFGKMDSANWETAKWDSAIWDVTSNRYTPLYKCFETCAECISKTFYAFYVLVDT